MVLDIAAILVCSVLIVVFVCAALIVLELPAIFPCEIFECGVVLEIPAILVCAV